MFILPVVQVCDVTARETIFPCPRYACSISAGSCAQRQAITRRFPKRMEYAHCRNCPDGALAERLSGGPVPIGKRTGKDDIARERGGKIGAKKQRAIATRRWEDEGHVPKDSAVRDMVQIGGKEE